MTLDKGCFWASAILFLLALVQYIYPTAGIPLVQGNVAIVALIAAAIGMIPNLSKMT
jgi:hypothetical protein